MAMDPSLPTSNLTTLEQEKFSTDADGNVIVRTSARGTFSVTGLSTAGRVTEVTIDSTSWTALPATALANRNAISIQNQSAVSIKLNYDENTVGYVGIEVPAGGERFYDISDSIVVYAKASSGSATVVIEELS